MSQIVNYSGKKFNHLTMIAYVRPGGSGQGAIWLTKCDCGNHKELLGRDVARGKVKSCGKCQYSRKHAGNPKGIRIPRDRRNYARQILDSVKHNKKWEITPDKYTEIVTGKCAVCGTSDRDQGHRVALLRDTDHYHPDSVAAICKACRKMKGSLSLAELLEHLIRIYNTGVISDLRKAQSIQPSDTAQ